MARKGYVRKDPWRELVARRDNEQVGIDEVLVDLSVGRIQARQFKKELLKRLSKVMRDK